MKDRKNAVQGLIRESEEKETTLFSGVKKMAGYIFFRSGTGLSNTDSFGRNRFSDVCVGDALHDPVWRDNDIRRNRKADRTMTEGFQRCRVRRLEMLSDATLCR